MKIGEERVSGIASNLMESDHQGYRSKQRRSEIGEEKDLRLAPISGSP